MDIYTAIRDARIQPCLCNSRKTYTIYLDDYIKIVVGELSVRKTVSVFVDHAYRALSFDGQSLSTFPILNFVLVSRIVVGDGDWSGTIENGA